MSSWTVGSVTKELVRTVEDKCRKRHTSNRVEDFVQIEMNDKDIPASVSISHIPIFSTAHEIVSTSKTVDIYQIRPTRPRCEDLKGVKLSRDGT